ncbi:MAG TPA: choice-of-anchor D domain-containing protein [Candidatus Kapabacteria bacterium]|nr:choice-of-anchor D domain-containing protein [Candidatus Kapabacteria bacterium]
MSQFIHFPMNSTASTAKRSVYSFALFAVLSLLSLFPSRSSAQGRVADYIVEQFDGGSLWDWNSTYTYLGWSDNTYYSVALPFAFSYDGNTVAANSTVRVSTNGWIQFTLPSYSPNGATTTYNQIGSSTYRNMIGVFAANMYPSGGIYHQTKGTSPNRTWTISYASTRFQASSSYPYISIELTLYEKDGTIEFRYSQPNLYMGSTSVNAGVGLNGHVVPSFQYRALENLSLDYSPARNWRMRPPRAAVPQLAVSLKEFDFGQALVGSAPQTVCVTVTNVGTAAETGAANTPLTFTGTAMNATNDFTLTSNPSQSLFAGESKDYCIAFSPVNMGVLSAGLNIKTNGKDSGSVLIPFRAFGLAGRLELPLDQVFRKTKTKVGHALEREIPIVNTGNYPMTILSAVPTGEYADQYSVVELPTNSIEPGASDTIIVSYDPIYEGLKMAELVVTTDAIFNPIDIVRMYGTGIIPRMTVTPGSIGIDSVRMGDTAYYTIRLTNVGTDTVVVREDFFTSADPDFFYQGLVGSDSLIVPESFREVIVGFAPQTRGTRQARLQLLTNLPLTFEQSPRDTSTFNIDFTVVAVPSGLLYVEGPTMVDSSHIGAEICRPVTIWNNGDETLTVNSAIIAGADAADFEITGATFPLTIPAMGSVNVQVCATPSARGLRNAMVTINAASNGETSTVDLPLSVFGQLLCAQRSSMSYRCRTSA